MNQKIKNNQNLGFTLIELLVVISILAVLMAISVFAIQGARKTSRDATRKTNLETIRSALELYKSDCGVYPTDLPYGSSLVGSETTGNTCRTTDTYMEEVPNDPLSATSVYSYKPTATGYVLCASLESGSTTADTRCQAVNANCTTTCNISVVNP